MKIPRFRLAWLMAFVAIAALNFGAMRALLGFNSVTARLLLGGALPMVNVLAVGILIAQRQPGSRTFLLGFEAFGAMALAFYVGLSFFPNEAALKAYFRLLGEPLEKSIGHVIPIPAGYLLALVMLAGPQVTFAVIGGFLSHRFKITLTRR